jgi:formylglycine-generating enzyme required for sulfatase activity
MTHDPTPASLLDDLPTDRDTLDFEPYVATLADLIASPATRTPLTIGVFGTWGSGKTSLMRMVRGKLPESFRTAWFDAWKYEKEETLWRALLLHVLSALKGAVPKNKEEDREELSDLETALYQPVDREKVGGLTIDWGRLGAGLGEGAVQIGLAFLPGGKVLADLIKELRKEEKSEEAIGKIVSAIHRQRAQIHIEQVQFLEQFHARFEALVDKHIEKKNLRLVVFVDDLDRCLPEKAVEVLEAIKLFVDVPGCVFVLGLDQEVIARGIEIKYREFGLAPGTPEAAGGEAQKRFMIDGARYLEKIIQLPFQIPPIERTDMRAFVSGLVDTWPHPACPDVFAEGLGHNPRQVKRTVNVFLLLWQLADKRKEKLQGLIKPIRLAKVVAIQHIYPELYEVLKETPRLLRDLEDYYRAESPSPSGRGDRGEGELSAAQTPRVEPPPALARFVSRAALRRLLTLHPADTPDANFTGLPPDELRLYFTLTRRAEAPQVAPTEAPRAVVEPQMVRVPAGLFLMGSTAKQALQVVADGLDMQFAERERPQHTVELSEYLVGKYPVTNAEYQAFVREAGYKPPLHWDGDKYPEGKGDHPVVNVSWDDAADYCKWLSEKTGKPYRLPTEAEWEKAARGADGRIYPWGNDWDPSKLNSAEGGARDTTPVGQYSPAGDSPYGCADMAGNVWEWCADWFDEQEYQRRAKTAVKDPQGPEKGVTGVVRGGSFNNIRGLTRTAVRRPIPPSTQNVIYGFRVAMSAAPAAGGEG